MYNFCLYFFEEQHDKNTLYTVCILNKLSEEYTEELHCFNIHTMYKVFFVVLFLTSIVNPLHTRVYNFGFEILKIVRAVRSGNLSKQPPVGAPER